MKKKIRADSVDELFEIVKAIQNGEEPEAYTKRKAAERKAEEEREAAEGRAEEQRKAAEQKARKQRRAAERRAERQQAAAERRTEEEQDAAERGAEGQRTVGARRTEEAQEAVEREAERQRTAGARRTEEQQTAAERESKKRTIGEYESKEDEAFERMLDEEPEEEFGEVRAVLGEAAERLKEAGSFLKMRLLDARKRMLEPSENGTQNRAEGEEPEEEESPRRRRRAARSEDRAEKWQEEPVAQKNIHTYEKEESVAGKSVAGNSVTKETETVTGKSATRESELVTGKSATKESELVTGKSATKKSGTEKSATKESEMEEIHSMGRVRLADLEKAPTGKTRRRYGANGVSEEAESVGWRILRSLHMESGSSDEKKAEKPTVQDVNPAEDELTAKAAHSAKDELPVQVEFAAKDESTAQEGPAAKDKLPTQAESAAQDESITREQEVIAAQGGTKSKVEPTESGTTAEESSAQQGPAAAEEPPAQQGPAAAEESSAQQEPAAAEGSSAQDTTAAKDEPPVQEATAQKNKTAARSIQTAAARIWQSLSGFFEQGFGKKQTAVLCAVFVIVILLASLGISAIRHTVQQREKQRYVTADAGLTVLVENQPEAWCNTWELELRFSVKHGSIATIAIDGVVYTPDESGIVTVSAANEQLQASVETDEGTLTASIEIPMLDEEEPALTVEKTNETIVLSAEDSRSGVAAIWYAVTEEDDWVQLPEYQAYSEPIAWEEGKTYYFYASDQAGNHSTPVVTSMEDAESLAFEETELSLFPGETVSLQAQVNPSGALVNTIAYDSSDENVVTVSSSGLVTAVAEGTAIVSASADGLDVAACPVTVASEQTVTISAIGDCTLGTYSGMLTSVSFDTYYSLYGATYFFQNVRDVLANDDATFANLEGPLTDAATAVEKEYAFKGDPSYTDILQDGSIEVVTLANNHSGDYGSEGLEDTKENLTEAGIDYCTGDTIAYQQISGVKVAFIGIYELATGLECESQVRETIAEAQSEGAELIIVAFHWGSEKENTPDETQQSLAHTAIDCGADLVVGHHPHVLQGIEKYNGKYIVYSLGNFCFGGNSNPSDKDTMIFRQTFTITQDGAADDDAIEIIPCTLSSMSGSNDYRPTVATGSDADAIMERINEYSAEFGDITYTASTGL
ncbi:MAG: CapA family protein [Lachnospiraceae bacterium]|nr:CapA family protein [Lachnospiraceae bacterium]